MRDEWSPLRLTTQQRIPAALGLLLLLAYAAVTLYVGLHHEPWRDEADVWLAARDMSIAEVIPGWTSHQGSPALWLLFLKLLTSAGLPYVSQTILNLAFTTAAAALLVFLGPFTRLTKVLLLVSYYFAYEYAIIARSYSVTVLLVFVALATMQRPMAFAIAVALLFNTNVHGGIIAGALLLVFVATRPRNRSMIVPLLVMVGGALAAFFQLRPGMSGGANPLAMRTVFYAVPVAIGDAFLPGPATPWIAIAGLAVIIAVGIALRRNRGAMLFLLEALVGLATVYTFVWFGGLRHSGLILISILAAIWMASDVPSTNASRVAAILLNLTLIGSAVYAFQNASADIRFAFSGSKDMGAFIDHRFDDREIAAHNLYASEAVLPYLPGRRFWYIGLSDYGTFLKWDAAQGLGAAMPYEIAVDSARRHFRGKRWLLLLDREMPQPERRGFRLIHATSVPVFRHLDERYWLYEPLS
jgi:hypothetical protein